LPKIFHSDRGTENLNEKCIKFFKENNVAISVSDPGSPWQNGHANYRIVTRLKTSPVKYKYQQENQRICS